MRGRGVFDVAYNGGDLSVSFKHKLHGLFCVLLTTYTGGWAELFGGRCVSLLERYPPRKSSFFFFFSPLRAFVHLAITEMGMWYGNGNMGVVGQLCSVDVGGPCGCGSAGCAGSTPSKARSVWSLYISILHTPPSETTLGFRGRCENETREKRK